MSKRFCYFQVPRCSSSDEVSSSTNDQHGIGDWSPDAHMSYEAETRWSAICASVKEEILELLFDRNRSDCVEKAK
jgi:hypothetical protein